ncbi:hypothetical protein ACQI4F_07135 [Mycolicibacterium vaccae]|uniref:hypothetical protein n=1 Tax=Mycolicibacterium vaccae TaxID=1810 RepID=UPI003CFAF1DF
MTGRQRDDDGQDSVAWHNRTSTLLAASVAALAAIAVVVSAVMYVTRQPEPTRTPMYLTETSRSATPTVTTRSTSRTTTTRSTRTSPPQTTDIDPALPTESVTESETETPTSTLQTRAPRTREEDDGTSTSRSRPRTNVTRTLSPAP